MNNESRLLRQEVKDWETKFSERVQDQTDQHEVIVGEFDQVVRKRPVPRHPPRRKMEADSLSRQSASSGPITRARSGGESNVFGMLISFLRLCWSYKRRDD